MNEFVILATAVIPITLIVAAGGLARRIGILSEEADRSLLALCINFLIPALIFDTILGNARLREWNNLLLPPIVGFCASSAGIGLAWVAARWSGVTTAAGRRAFAVTTGLQNYLYYALPLTALLFDQGTVGVMFVHNLGVETVLWTVAMAVLSAQGLTRSWRGALNPPVISIVTALGLNLVQAHFISLQSLLRPGGVILTTAHNLGQCAVPLALLLIGAMVADHWHDLRAPSSGRIVSGALLVRFAILPVMYLVIARILPCSIELKRVLAVQGTMPSAMFPVILTRQHNGDSRLALQIVLATTVASLLMIPIWMRLAGLFLHW